MANNQVLMKADSGIEIKRMSYTNTSGDIIEIEDPRTEVNKLMALLCSEKQKFIKKEKDEIENKKSLQSVVKTDLVISKSLI